MISNMKWHTAFITFLVLIANSAWADSFNNLLEQAEHGAVQSQLSVGKAYLNGLGVSRDTKKAFYWYQKAADQGNPAAQTRLGWMFENGKGVTRDYKKAYEWYKKAAEQGYAQGQRPLGVLYELGKGVKKDSAKAAYWYKKAAEQGIARAQVNLGILYETGLGVEKDYEQALYWYRESIKRNYARGQTQLGRMYEYGHGVEKDLKQAKFWYEKAAAQNYSKAKFFLVNLKSKTQKSSEIATSKTDGDNKKLNEEFLDYSGRSEYTKEITNLLLEQEKPLKHYLAAAEKGNVDAQSELGLKYFKGVGVEKDLTKAAYWFNKAAEQGDLSSQNNLGLMYINGLGVEKNPTVAAKWLQKAAKQGDSAAENNLAIMYINGTGVDKDTNKALELLKRAAGKGHKDAQYNLASMYYKDPSLNNDYKIIVELLKKSALQGHVDAQYDLASMFYNGHGVKKDLENSVFWLKKAADQGDDEASSTLRMVQNELEDARKASAKVDTAQPTSTDNTLNPADAVPSASHLNSAADHFYNGNKYAQDEKYDLAINEYKKAIELDPDNANTYENLAIVYTQSGENEKAVQTMQIAIQKDPEDALKHATLGTIYHANQDSKNALNQYIKSVNLNPGIGWIYNNIAFIYLQKQQYNIARQSAKQAEVFGYPDNDLLAELQKRGPQNDSPEGLTAKTEKHIRQIVVATRKEAEKTLKLLQAGEDFSQTASQKSLAPHYRNGGYIGLLKDQQMNAEIEAILKNLPPFIPSPIIKTAEGFHIFQTFIVGQTLLKDQ